MTTPNIKKEKIAIQENFEKRYSALNEEQKKAVDTIDGPVVVIAGPGSGKTELLSLRTANILKLSDISPHNILLLTFTDSGARNMRDRLVDLIGETAYRVAVYTFHSFASDVLSRHAEYFWNGASYRPATEIEKLGIIGDVLSTLARSNPLSSRHFENGYTYMSEVVSCISALKKGNMSAEDFKNKIQENIKNYQEINNIVGETIAEVSGKRDVEVLRAAYLSIYEELNKISKTNETALYLANTLSFDIKRSLEAEKPNKILNDWRDEYFTKNVNGTCYDSDINDYKILKDSRPEKAEKWLALCDVYAQYYSEMNQRGLYDFDDMIFKVARELETNVSLRNELEEKYQYIMIDEFQDTNESQFSLVKSLTSSPVNEGRPNLLAVGDDDQAIYKFQGAELDNITRFVENYKGVEFITLDKNYRSTQNILDSARNIITKIEDRLENKFPSQINKKIKAANKNLIDKHKGVIIEQSFDSVHSEYDYVANQIKEILSTGVAPSEISIISKKHSNLKNISKVLGQYSIPYSYDKKENVLDKDHISELITIVEYVTSGLTDIRDELLPTILSYKFWDISRVEIWKIAEKVKAGNVVDGELGERTYNKISWLQAMRGSENFKIKETAQFLIELISDAKSMPLEHLLDKIIGTKDWEIDENIADLEFEVSRDSEKDADYVYTSPYKNYYFGRDNFEHNKPKYLEFLFALRTFMGSLREYKQGELLHASDLQEFVSVYKDNSNLSLTLSSPFATAKDAVVLQTAHKSKGLEYEYVFIISSDEDEWNGRGFINKIGMPIELKLLPESDSIDDKVRLYYVAMTRAKHTLYITHNKNKFSVLLDDAADENKKSKIITDTENISEQMLSALYITSRDEYVEDEKILLSRLLENYKMPVTHMTNFLNIGKVGPEKFVEQNLLRFPQAMSASSVYGSAMHEAMQNYYLYFKKYQKLTDIEKLKGYFENALNRGTLTKNDYDKYLKSGYDSLKVYIDDLLSRTEEIGYRSKIKDSDMVEVNFANESVHIGLAHASGKIDKMQFAGDSIYVTDLKTGKSFDSWEPKKPTEYDKIKLHFFKYQLTYYALLIKNSRSYNQYKVDYGYIEFLESDPATLKLRGASKINILELKVEDDLLERVTKLTNVIYSKIMDLDFPDTSKYKINEKGEEREVTLQDILDFEEELLSGSI